MSMLGVFVMVRFVHRRRLALKLGKHGVGPLPFPSGKGRGPSPPHVRTSAGPLRIPGVGEWIM